MKYSRALAAGMFAALAITAAAQKIPSKERGSAGNRELQIKATAVTDRKQVTQLMGVDLGEGYVVVKVQVKPQTGEPVRVDPDDFTLIVRKNGERNAPMDPEVIVAPATMRIDRPKNVPGFNYGDSAPTATSAPRPIEGKAPPSERPRLKRAGKSEAEDVEDSGEASSDSPKSADAKSAAAAPGDTPAEDPRLAPLKAKALNGAESAQPMEGFLYFLVDSKVKPKDLGLVYSGQAGHLAFDLE